LTDARPPVLGLELDTETRCRHYRGARDIIAIRMRCCGEYHACRECHDALADHAATVWPAAEWDQPAVLCGACGVQMSVAAYLASGHRCPACGAAFNPGCASHHHLYFEAGPQQPTDPPASWNKAETPLDPAAAWRHSDAMTPDSNDA
jgi:uncharacterized CHY-type Zn-finger protein